MAGKINNLFEIISAPGLEDSKYGEHINAQFNNINENFAALANREFVQGPDGQGVNVVEIKFVGSNLTTQSPYITISKDLEASIKAAFETYLKYTRMGGTLTFTDLLKEAGLGDPFDEETLCRVCRDADRYLENYDLTGIV